MHSSHNPPILSPLQNFPVSRPHTNLALPPSLSPLAGSLELGWSAPNEQFCFEIRIASIQPQSNRERGYPTVCQWLRGGKGDSKDTNNLVPSCPIKMFFPAQQTSGIHLPGLSPLHAIGAINAYISGRCG